MQSHVVSNTSTSFIDFKLATNKGSPSSNEETEGEGPIKVEVVETKTLANVETEESTELAVEDADNDGKHDEPKVVDEVEAVANTLVEVGVTENILA